jgi:hypothetical protein
VRGTAPRADPALSLGPRRRRVLEGHLAALLNVKLGQQHMCRVRPTQHRIAWPRGHLRFPVLLGSGRAASIDSWSRGPKLFLLPACLRASTLPFPSGVGQGSVLTRGCAARQVPPPPPTRKPKHGGQDQGKDESAAPRGGGGAGARGGGRGQGEGGGEQASRARERDALPQEQGRAARAGSAAHAWAGRAG